MDSGSRIGRVRNQYFQTDPMENLKLSFRSGATGLLQPDQSTFSRDWLWPSEGNTVVQFRAILCEMGHLSVIIS